MEAAKGAQPVLRAVLLALSAAPPAPAEPEPWVAPVAEAWGVSVETQEAQEAPVQAERVAQGDRVV